MSSNEVASGLVHTVPKDLEVVLLANNILLDKWNNLTILARNEWICWVTAVKLPETRQKHIDRLAVEIREGKKRPCCWPGCSHRDKKHRNINKI